MWEAIVYTTANHFKGSQGLSQHSNANIHAYYGNTNALGTFSQFGQGFRHFNNSLQEFLACFSSQNHIESIIYSFNSIMPHFRRKPTLLVLSRSCSTTFLYHISPTSKINNMPPCINIQLQAPSLPNNNITHRIGPKRPFWRSHNNQCRSHASHQPHFHL